MDLIGSIILGLFGVIVIMILVMIVIALPVLVVGSILAALAPEAFDEFLTQTGTRISKKLRGE